MRLGFSPLTAMMFDTEAAFRLADELGLAFVELSHDLHEVMPALQDPERVRALTRATGIGTTVHLSFLDLNLASLIPAARRTAVERTQAGLEFAEAVGATCGVLHSGRHYLRDPRVDPLVDAALAESLAALVPGAVPIALENLALDEDDLLRTPEQLRTLVDRHGVRSCLDVGHAHVQGTRDGFDALGAYLATLGDTIAHLHLHDNHGQRDEHLATGRGTIDYGAQRPYLEGFAGTICLEIGGGEDAVRASVAHLRGLVAGR